MLLLLLLLPPCGFIAPFVPAQRVDLTVSHTFIFNLIKVRNLAEQLKANQQLALFHLSNTIAGVLASVQVCQCVCGYCEIIHSPLFLYYFNV